MEDAEEEDRRGREGARSAAWRGDTSRGSAARDGDGPRARRARGERGVCVRRRGEDRERGMKMQKGAGGLAQYRNGGASAFILFFVHRVARSFFQDGRTVRARRCITSVTRAPREGWQRHPTLPIEKGTRKPPSAAWRVGRSLLLGVARRLRF